MQFGNSEARIEVKSIYAIIYGVGNMAGNKSGKKGGGCC
jgi:hypothetical protein